MTPHAMGPNRRFSMVYSRSTLYDTATEDIGLGYADAARGVAPRSSGTRSSLAPSASV
jgi:hypothetical protein